MKSPTSIFSKNVGYQRCTTGYCLAVGLCVIFISQIVVAQQSETIPASTQRNDTISNQGFSIQANSVNTQPVADMNKELMAEPQQNPEQNHKPTQNEKPEMNTAGVSQVQSKKTLIKRLPRRLTGVAGKEMQSQPSSPVSWYRTGIGALSIVLCMMGGVYFLARKWFPSIRVMDSRAIHVVARATITPKHQAALIQMGRRFVLVGISGEHMNTLCEITNPEEIAELTTRMGLSQSPHATGFENMLSRETQGYVESAMDPATEVMPNADQQQNRRASWLKTPALSELKKKLRSLQHRSS